MLQQHRCCACSAVGPCTPARQTHKLQSSAVCCCCSENHQLFRGSIPRGTLPSICLASAAPVQEFNDKQVIQKQQLRLEKHHCSVPPLVPLFHPPEMPCYILEGSEVPWPQAPSRAAIRAMPTQWQNARSHLRLSLPSLSPHLQSLSTCCRMQPCPQALLLLWGLQGVTAMSPQKVGTQKPKPPLLQISAQSQRQAISSVAIF